MKPKISSSRNKQGSTYLVVVVTMVVVGLMLAAYLKLIDVQNQLTTRSQTWNRTVPVIEAGIEEAMAHLNLNGSPDAGGNFDLSKLTRDGWSGNPSSGWYRERWFENDHYAVKIEAWTGSVSNFPKIYSTGTVQHLPAFALNKRFGAFLASALLEEMLTNKPGLFSRRVVECTTTNLPTFTRGLVTKRGIDMNGKNIETDSYDSLDENHSDFGRYDAAERKDNGDIASNGQIINVGNATVRGKVSTGPFGTVSLGTGVVGDSAYCDNPANAGTIQPGHFTDDMNVEFHDVTLPVLCSVAPTNPSCATWFGLPTTSGTTTINSNTYRYVLDTGDYEINGSTLDDSIYVRGNVRLLVKSGINITGNNLITVGTNGSLKIYADCPTVNIGGKGIVNDSGSAIRFQYFGTVKNTSISLGGNGQFVGTIYAPYAHLDFNGGGSSTSFNDFSGAAMVASAKFNGHFKFHYDEALPKIGAWKGFVITSWNEK